MTALLPPWAEAAEVLSGAGGERPYVHVPDVATNLVFRTTTDRRSDLIVVGPRTRGSYHPDKVVPLCLRLRLRPGHTRAVLGMPVHHLVDRAVPITHVWGLAGRRLQDRLAATTDPAEALTHLVRTLDAHTDGSASGSRRQILAAAMTALSPGSDSPGLAEVAADLAISERHLRAIFIHEIGLSPKHFARITRLRHVLNRAGRQQWSQLADEAGFFDQSHMIADFRTLMGVPPAAYTAGRLPAPSPCAALARPTLR
jgi:AraC-like DNA-binding protein